MKIKELHKNHNFVFLAVASIIFLLFWQAQRSNWPATLTYWYQSFKYHVLRVNSVEGEFTSQISLDWHRQQHSLSCEIASLKMALSAFHINVSESEIISKLHFDPTKRSKGVWGDPFTGFVGDIDGVMGVSGYGVYWDPIAEVANEYTRAEVKRFNKPSDLAFEIGAGRPVISWGFNGHGEKITWTTPQGKQINATNGEHARVVAGFAGPPDAPTHFIVYDPIYGKLLWSAEEVFNNWAPFDNMGIVVYADPNSIFDANLIIQ